MAKHHEDVANEMRKRLKGEKRMTDEFYNQNATQFFEGTVHAKMRQNYEPFLKRVLQGGNILDAGCGSGRDSLAFKKMGYQVTAIDGSKALCKLASEYIGQEVLNVRFQDLEFENEFDGIWACATLLHVPSSELPQVVGKLKRALKKNGVIYASFKQGTYEGERNGRYFTDLTEETAKKLFSECGFKVEEIWITGDVREGRGGEKWVNLIGRK